jgi:hypothetical protein
LANDLVTSQQALIAEGINLVLANYDNLPWDLGEDDQMAKFIKLKDEDGDEVAVNVDMITKVRRKSTRMPRVARLRCTAGSLTLPALALRAAVGVSGKLARIGPLKSTT